MNPQVLKFMQDNNIIFLGFSDNRIPEFKEVNSKDWILFGEDNKFPDHLLYLYNKSSNHNAIVDGKVIYVFGGGFESGKIKVNPMGETLNKVFEKFVKDIELFGGGRLEVLWKFGGKAELRHLPFQYLRRAKEKNGYWYSKNWAKYTQKQYQPVFMPDFDDKNKKGAQVFAYNEYRPGADHYPLPGYFGALNDIETDVEISKYNLSVIKNGMFSSKMIVFNNGVPVNEVKKKIESDFKKKFAGSENSGNFMLVFNDDPAKAPTVQDLSTTDLDKLFDQLNKTTQSEIFTGHLVTSPMLFGVKTEGQLGGRTEITESYEIFKNTYISKKQDALKEIAEIIFPAVGAQVSDLVPVEPISEKIDPIDFKDMLPKEWVHEQLGIDTSKYPSTQNPVNPAMPAAAAVNDNLKNITGRQFQGLTRILNRFKAGKLQRAEAELLLKKSFGLGDEDVTVLLSEQTFSADYTEDEVAMMFETIGDSKSNYHILKSVKFDGEFTEKMAFADLSQTDSEIINMIGKDKRISSANIAAAIKSTTDYVNSRIESLINEGVLTQTTKRIGVDTVIEHAVNPESIDYRPKPDSVDVYVKYSYELRPGVKGPEVISTTRPFCKRLIELNRVYTRAEIETISQRLGYSVFDRAGGFWGDSPKCRHEWRRNIIIKKK